MSGVLAPHGDDWAQPPTPFRKALAWFRHYSSWFVIGGAVIILIEKAVRCLYVPQSPLWLACFGFAVMVLWFLGAMESNRHAMRWCEPCVWRRVTENGREAAEQKLRQLRLFHLCYDHQALYSIAFLVFVAAAWFAHGLLEFALYAPLVVSVSAASVAEATHAQHRPWCPLCRHGGGGDGQHVNEPPPDPSDSAPVTPQEVRRV